MEAAADPDLKTATLPAATPRRTTVALRIGDPAPEFTLTDSNGESVSLRDLRGKKVLLYFYTMSGGNNCTRMAHGYREHAGDLQQKNTVVYGMNDGDAAAAKAWV